MVYTAVGSGKQERKQKTIHFASPRYKEERVIYPWKNSYLGQRGLCWIYIYARKFGTDDDLLTHPPAALGIIKEGVEAWLRLKESDLFEDFEFVTGIQLSPLTIMSRFGNMFRNNRRKNFELGEELPKNHPLLKPVLDAILREELLRHGIVYEL